MASWILVYYAWFFYSQLCFNIQFYVILSLIIKQYVLIMENTVTYKKKKKTSIRNLSLHLEKTTIIVLL